MHAALEPAVLVVTDDQKAFKDLSSWLNSEGFESLIAINYTEALKAVQERNVDVALVDLKLRKENGITMSRRLLDADEDLKIIIVTGYPSYEGAVKAMKIGVHDYLSREVPRETILKSIKNALKRRENERLDREKEFVGSNVVKILLFCNHSLIRERLENFSASSPDFKVLKSYSSIESFQKTKGVPQTADIAMVCAGCIFKGIKDAYFIIPEIYRRAPGIKPIIINENFPDRDKVELLKLGIKGFFSLDLSSKMLEKALARIKKGEIWVSRSVTNLSLKELLNYQFVFQHKKKEAFGLTFREIEILKTISRGMTNKEIAQALFISDKTVKTHVNRIFKKLGVNNRTRAIIVSIERGLLR